MADEPTTTPAPSIQGNDPTARTPEGTIVDQQTKQPDGSANQDTVAEAAKAAEAAKTAEGKKPEPGAVPEKYEFKPAEGAELDTKLVEAVTPLFKELGISQEAGQKLFDFHNKAMADQAAAGTAAMTEMRDAWRGEVVKDPALGNGTDNLKPEVRANIAKAIEAVGDAKAVESFKEAMDLTGIGDNPALIRGLNNIGKLLSEGTLVRGGGPSAEGQSKTGAAARPTPAQAMYPNNPSSAAS